MDKVLRVLRFLRLTDEQDNLSLTNLAVLGTFSFALSRPDMDLNSLLAFVTAAVGYQVKRGIKGKDPADAEDTEFVRNQIKELQSKVTGLQLGRTMQR